MGQRLAELLREHRHGSAHDSPTAAAAAAAAAIADGQLLQAAAGGSASVVDGKVPHAAAAAAAGATAPAAAMDRDAELLPALGLDLEWQPDAENSSPPSLLQISTGAGVVC